MTSAPAESDAALTALLAAAREARGAAYAPYSHFAVGAAVLTDDDRIVIGANVENASYGLTLCAERVAVMSAISTGSRRLRALALAGPPGSTTLPCGACRQVLSEFADALPIVYVAGDRVVTTRLDVLLPQAFGAATLREPKGPS